ncbi:MAG TPA: bifunctional hydroxymethylpyrimidine kinase/phosphomethylpyrimidine kinase [Candidatus Udaeobacter sp.]|jgi:hydroxymethylpyrimidine/phosphomethylpyrimidine kinase|nr:bifunctional hydroxymethylpyrimidine kinase/phosphomethylpyrimidine kinase [Candidatus Udaeobacter sp.]
MVGRDRRARRDRATSNKKAPNQSHTPVALSIAGSDCSAGAGIQADLKTFTALGVYGLTAVTCIVAEVPRKVSRIESLSATIVREQIKVLLENFRVGAIKTGLLCSEEIVCAVAQAIQDAKKKTPRPILLVVDPVMIATSGDSLLGPGAIESYKTKLFPLATLITPNLDEAASLLATTIEEREQMENAAKDLAKEYRASILLKGGHLRGDKAIDLLFHHGELIEFSAPFVRGVKTHGTGCTYSAAITAGLASGFSLEQAIKQAKKFVSQSISQHFRWRSKSGIVDSLRHSF